MTTTHPEPATGGSVTLEIACAKPDCHWRGSPADAPNHPCPTPALGPDTLDEAEAATLRNRLTAAGVAFDPQTGLDGLRELYLMVGDAGPLEREMPLEPTVEPELEPLTDPVRPDADPDRDPLDAAADALTHAVADVIDRGQREKGKPTLFDASDYDREDLALPKIDGHPIDRIAVGFGGEIMLDRSNPDHVALWRRLKLGRTVELWVEAKGLGFTGKGATNKDGELDVIVAKRSVVVQHVRILAPEDLENAADEIVAQARDAAEAEQESD